MTKNLTAAGGRFTDIKADVPDRRREQGAERINVGAFLNVLVGAQHAPAPGSRTASRGATPFASATSLNFVRWNIPERFAHSSPAPAASPKAQQRALEESWPKYGVEFDGTRTLDLDALFGRRAPRVVEIGFGNGENLAALATTHPERDYLGIEVHRAGVGRLMLAARDRTAHATCASPVTTQWKCSSISCRRDSLDEILILFPDPWRKKRHHKRRLIQPPFVELAVSRLKAGGVLRLATDWEPYAVQMLEVLSANPDARESLTRARLHREDDRAHHHALREARPAARARRVGSRLRASGNRAWLIPNTVRMPSMMN